MIRRFACVSVAVFTLAAIAAQAADDVLNLVPADALGCFVIYRLEATDAKFQELARRVQAPAVSLLAEFKQHNGITKGLNEKGSLVGIIMPGTGDEPCMVGAFPVTDYREFVDQLKPTKPDGKITEVELPDGKHVVAKLGNYAILVESKDRKALEAVLAAKENIAGKTAGLESWLATQDVAFLATPVAIKKAREGLVKVKKQLGELPMHQPGMLASLDVYSAILQAAEKEVSLFAAGGSVDKDGTLRIAARLRLQSAGVASALLATVKPAEGDLLAGLPKGSFVFAAGGVTPESFTKAMLGLATTFMTKNQEIYGLSPEQTAKLVKLSLASMQSVRGVSMVMRTGKSGDPIYSNILGVIRVDNAEKYLQDYEKQIAATNEILKEAKESIMKPMTAKKTDVGGKAALEVEMTIPVPKPAAAMPEFDKFMELLIGPGGKATVCLAAANETSIVFGYATPKQAMLETMQSLNERKPGLSAETDLAATAARLPVGAQWVGYISPRGCVSLVARVAGAMMGGMGGESPMIPPFPKTPPIGAAVKASSGELYGELVVPSAVLKAIGEYATRIQEHKPEIP